MILSYLNAELDAKQEYELNLITPFGFNVEIKYNKSFYGFDQRPSQKLNNVTEVHNLFSNSIHIAFESDIHAQGFIRNTQEIESVVITLAIENSTSFEF